MGAGAEGSEDAGEMTETSVGSFDAVTVRLPDAMAQGGEFSGATCATRTYVWGMGNASGAGNSDNAGSDSSGQGNSGQGNSGANDNNAKNLLIVTVYQTSGDECNADQVMTQFLAGFQNGSDSNTGSGSGSDSGSGTSGSGTGTTTP
jgi:hypothetical protein